MLPLVAYGAATLAVGTLSKMLGKDKDYPTAWGGLAIVNGKAQVVGKVNVLDKGNVADGNKLMQASADHLNQVIDGLGLSEEERNQLNTPGITVGIISKGRKGAVSKPGFFFGQMDGGNKFLSGIGKDQGYQSPEDAITNLSKYMLQTAGSGADEATAGKVNTVIPNITTENLGLNIKIPETFNQSNVWTTGGKIAQVAGAAMIGAGVAGVGSGGAAAAQTGGAAAVAPAASAGVVPVAVAGGAAIPTAATAAKGISAGSLMKNTKDIYDTVDTVKSMVAGKTQPVARPQTTTAPVETPKNYNIGNTSIGVRPSGTVNLTAENGENVYKNGLINQAAINQERLKPRTTV